MQFEKQINDFETLGYYDYKFDEGENVIVNSSSFEFSYHYLSLPLQKLSYDDKEIESYYDVKFKEFVPPLPDETIEEQKSLRELSEKSFGLKEENERLKNQIDSLIEKSESDSSIARDNAVKRVILDLRIMLGEGESNDDFSEDFPYAPVKE